MRVTPHRHIPRRFVELASNKRVVEIDEFETKDPALRGERKSTIELLEKDGGAEVVAVHERGVAARMVGRGQRDGLANGF
jgi:hypothetical protein